MKNLRLAFVLLCTFAVVSCSGGAGGGKGSTLLPQSPTTQSLPKPHAVVKGRKLRKPLAARLRIDSTITDPGFESGAVGAWYQCGYVNASYSTAKAHAGIYSQLDGQLAKPEVNGDSGLCQDILVPNSGVLTFWVYQGTNETSTTYAYQEADFLDASGYVIANFYTSAATTTGWVQKSYDVSAYAGQQLSLYFGVHADGYTGGYMYQYVDDVAWGNTSTPAPTATPVPTATPIASATPIATATPIHTATPVPSPTPTPVKTPTPAPTATPTPSGGPTPIATPAGQGSGSCGTSCGVQRWHIKTLDDAYTNTINWLPIQANVSTLTAAPVPANYNEYNDTTRYAPFETQSYTIRATLVGWKTESDHDYHIVIADVNNPSNTMIVEPPDPNCTMACQSNFGNYYSSVRTKFTNCFGAVPSGFTNFPSGVVVDLTGVPEFDALHGQTGVAPNGIELHPLLSVKFISGAPGC